MKSGRARVSREQRHRIFIGIPMPEELYDEVSNWRNQYSEILPVRWIPLDSLHITLVPPWEEEHIGKVIKKMKNVSSLPALFSVHFHIVMFGPEQSRPRLIWGEGDCPGEIEDLRRAYEKELRRPRAKRPFKLHLTLARFPPQNFKMFPVQHLADPVSWQFPVEWVRLYESHLLPSGAEYEVLYEQRLDLCR